MTTLPVYIPDYTARIIADDFLNKVRHLPRWRAFAAGLGCGLQSLEDDLFAIVSGQYFPTANGFFLDRWGAIVGEQRGGLTDEEYRSFIRARIMTTVCGGTGDEYIRIYSLVTAPNLGVRLVGKYPAGFVLRVLRDSPMRDEVARRVVRMMDDAKADGLGMGLSEAVLTHFGFKGDPLAAGFGEGLLARRLR